MNGYRLLFVNIGQMKNGCDLLLKLSKLPLQKQRRPLNTNKQFGSDVGFITPNTRQQETQPQRNKNKVLVILIERTLLTTLI